MRRTGRAGPLCSMAALGRTWPDQYSAGSAEPTVRLALFMRSQIQAGGVRMAMGQPPVLEKQWGRGQGRARGTLLYLGALAVTAKLRPSEPLIRPKAGVVCCYVGKIWPSQAETVRPMRPASAGL